MTHILGVYYAPGHNRYEDQEYIRGMWYNTGVANQKSDRGDALTSRGLGNCRERTATVNEHTSNASALKVCKTCGESKPLTEYGKYTSGSYRADCRLCAAAYARQRRAANPEHVRDIKNRSYAKNRQRINKQISERIASEPDYRKERNERKRHWHQQNREYVSQYRAGYYAANSELVKQQSREQYKRHTEKVRARSAVAYAVARGVFPPAWTMVCEHCQEALAAQWHHHKGYAEEYEMDVIALCFECHGKEHRIDD